jgi:hypothetical protein
MLSGSIEMRRFACIISSFVLKVKIFLIVGKALVENPMMAFPLMIHTLL